MSKIKLPIRALYPDSLQFVDADGQPVAPDDIAAALNAAPKRAFEELTVRELCAMMEGDDVSEEQLLSRLQAFAAPVAPAWRLITVDAVKDKGYLLLRPIADLEAQAPIVAKFDYSAFDGEPEWQKDDGNSYAFHCFDGWLPLPAAPDAGGNGHD